MGIVRWEPFRELHTLQSEVNRLFDAAGDRPSGHARRWVPAMDLTESPDHYVLTADLPGLSEEDVRIEVEDRMLTVSGERKLAHDKGEGFMRVERAFGAFSRSLQLPDGVDAEGIMASFDRGVLTVLVPKPAARKPRRIEIAVGGAERPAEIEGRTADEARGGDAATAA